jgi:cell division protein FtsI/penicillin-binding protein 2
MAAVMVVAVGWLTIGFAMGFSNETSAEPTIQAFLLDWQQGKYAQAAALTTGDTGQVAAQLAAAYTDLNATNTFLAMGPVKQHGSTTAVAAFTATVDLAEGGHQWTYTGQFSLTARNGRWLVDWAPNVVNPSLGPGDRLAVVTTFAPRAQVEDSSGQPLLKKSAVYHVGVYPDRLSNAARTAEEFSAIAVLNSQQVLGQINAAPPRQFLSLLTLDPSSPSFNAMRSRLAKVPGLSPQWGSERLFDSPAAEVVGNVGTENSDALRAEGAAYQPGETMGLSGLEQTYQNALAGTPATAVVVVNSAGRPVATLRNWPGQAGAPVRTTISGHDQAAAAAALANEPNSAEIVAVDSRTGDIRALTSREAGSVRLPPGGALNAKVEPGMGFSIVSAAALLGLGSYSAATPVPCQNTMTIGGQEFTYTPRMSSATFAHDFAAGCGTAFASMSQKLSPQRLTAVERSFGIGAPWKNLRVQAFSGSAAAASGAAGVAAQAIGESGVLMSPLAMAMVAAEVDSGTGRAPVLIASDPATTWQAPLSAGELSQLRQLMRQAVQSGNAHGAELSGKLVYGQAGVVKTGANAWLGWFVGYRGSMAVTVLGTGTTSAQAQQAASSLAGTFLSKVSS